MKICNKCKIPKELSKFYAQKAGKQGVFATCKECSREIARKKYNQNPEEERKKKALYKAKNPLKTKMIRLKYRYGITADEYNTLFEKQAGRCAVCKRDQSEIGRMLDVDHCHETGKVRGLLCNNCNQGIGQLKDDPIIIESALMYLKSYQHVN